MKDNIGFNFEKNIHMYNHRLTITINGSSYSDIIEDSPYTPKTLLIWLDDFNIPNADSLLIKTKIKAFFEQEGYITLFQEGKRV